MPTSCLVVDSKGVCSVISFYGTNNTLKEKVHVGDLCYIKNPQLIFTSITFQGRMYAYQCVKVNDISDVLINAWLSDSSVLDDSRGPLLDNGAATPGVFFSSFATGGSLGDPVGPNGVLGPAVGDVL